jgi:hypothetical protein
MLGQSAAYRRDEGKNFREHLLRPEPTRGTVVVASLAQGPAAGETAEAERDRARHFPRLDSTAH